METYVEGNNAHFENEFDSCLSRPSGLVSRVLAATVACITGTKGRREKDLEEHRRGKKKENVSLSFVFFASLSLSPIISIIFSFRLQETAPITWCVKLQGVIANKPKRRGLGTVTSRVVQMTCAMLAQLGRHYSGFLGCVSSLIKCFRRTS